MKLDKIEETDLQDSLVETETESFKMKIHFPVVNKNRLNLGNYLVVLKLNLINLSESDIGPFDILYGKIDEDNFHQKMEGNDLTYYPLFSDKKFLNEDWHSYTCIESCAVI